MTWLYFLIKHDDEVLTFPLIHLVHFSQFRVVRSFDLVLLLLLLSYLFISLCVGRIRLWLYFCNAFFVSILVRQLVRCFVVLVLCILMNYFI